ncbi:MAG: sialate O-acetylesterase [Erysipelotrichia bacterium]|nr:sialate O-acetylesterase [Erysipelotrichia bacterium]
MKNNRLFFFTSLLSLCLAGCGGGNHSHPPEEQGPAVFILTGQSNMNGQTSYSNLRNVFTNLDIEDGEVCYEGIPEIRTSYFGVGYGEIYGNAIHASNKTNPLEGQFENTVVGMGSNANNMGPEVGLAYKLRNHASAEKPIYFIKMGISGSGFDQGTPTKGSNGRGAVVNWDIEQDPNLYEDFLKPYVENCLELIKEEADLDPVIKGFIWHQGESDSAPNKIPHYASRFNALVDQVREDFVDYALDYDPENIAVIDALIYDGDDTAWGKQTSQDLNQAKINNAVASTNYYCVNTSMKKEGGAQLGVGSPGGDSMHYNTESSFKLGMLYADAIIDNYLLD